MMRQIPDTLDDLIAKIVFQAMRYQREGETPDWSNSGNSDAQNCSRDYTRKIIELIQAGDELGEGVVAVSEEPDIKMCNAGLTSIDHTGNDPIVACANIFKAMVQQNKQ